jgi:uncharacterized protein (DUF4415 family)
MGARGEFESDWAKAGAMTQEELEKSIAEDPDDVHEPVDWTKAVKGIPLPKKDIHIRLDADVLAWFKSTGRGYQTRINNVLRAFMASRKHP